MRLLLVLSLTLFQVESAVGAPRPVVAVLPLQDSTGLPGERVEGLSDYLRIRVAALGKVDVVDKGLQEAETQRLVSEAQAESYRACVDEACQIPLGKQLAANYLLRSTHQRFESIAVLSLELVDVASAASTFAVTERVDGGPDGLLSSIDRAVLSLGARLEAMAPSSGALMGESLDDPKAGEVALVFGYGGLGTKTSSQAPVSGAWVQEPPPDGPSTTKGVIYLGVAAALLAGGLVLDLAPDSAHNGGLDFLDLMPLVAYGTSFLFGMAGLGNLL